MAPAVHHRRPVYTLKGAVRGACLLREIFSPHVRMGVAVEGHGGITLLLGAPVHQAELINVEVAGACTTLPLIRLPPGEVFLEGIDQSKAPTPRLLDLFVY